jgi:hypothetical protein
MKGGAYQGWIHECKFKRPGENSRLELGCIRNIAVQTNSNTMLGCRIQCDDLHGVHYVCDSDSRQLREVALVERATNNEQR